MSVWMSKQAYSTRVARLTQGVGKNNSIRLDETTIGADGSVDSASGGDDDDWFLLGGVDILLDRLARERLLRA